MTDFLTRVVLIDGTGEDYATLDLAMSSLHFTRTMKSSVGVSYQLPCGSYFSQSISMTASEVRNLALVATRAIGKRVDILTTAGGETSFFLHPLKT